MESDEAGIFREKLGPELVQKVIESMTSGPGAALNTAEFCKSLSATYQYNTVNRGPGMPPPTPTDVLERVRAILTANQSNIFNHLWEKKTAGYDTLTTIPKAWRDVPSDEAIEAALKRIRTRLEENNLPVTLVISTAKRRVNIEHLGGK